MHVCVCVCVCMCAVNSTVNPVPTLNIIITYRRSGIFRRCFIFVSASKRRKFNRRKFPDLRYSLSTQVLFCVVHCYIE